MMGEGPFRKGDDDTDDQKIIELYFCRSEQALMETAVGFACWEKDGVRYTIMDSGAKVTPQTLFAMAKELME